MNEVLSTGEFRKYCKTCKFHGMNDYMDYANGYIVHSCLIATNFPYGIKQLQKTMWLETQAGDRDKRDQRECPLYLEFLVTQNEI